MLNLTERSVIAIGSYLKFLEGLDLSDNINIKGEFLVYLKTCSKLNRLLVNGIKLKDNDMIFTDYLNKLKTLSFSNAQNLTDSSINFVIKNCCLLENLKMDKNQNFTEESNYYFNIFNRII